MPKIVTCQMPAGVMSGVRTLQIRFYPDGLLITRLIDRFSAEMIVAEYVSVTARIKDKEFFNNHNIEEFKVDDDRFNFFERVKQLGHLSGIKLPNNVSIKNNNGAVMRELIFRALVQHDLLKITEDGSVLMAEQAPVKPRGR